LGKNRLLLPSVVGLNSCLALNSVVGVSLNEFGTNRFDGIEAAVYVFHGT